MAPRDDTRRTGVFTRRALLMMGGQVALLGGLAARLYQVQVVEGGRYATLAEENRISARLIAPPRGRMLDRFGTVVAGNRLNWRALLIAEQTADVDRDARHFRPHRAAGRLRARPHRARGAPPPPLHPDHGARVPDLGRDGGDRGQRARPARHPGRCRHHAASTPTASSSPMSSATSRRPPRRTSPTIRMLALPGIRVGRAGLEKEHDLDLRGTRRRGAARGERARPGDPRTGPPGGHAGRGARPHHRCGLQQAVLRPARRRERQRRGAGLPQRRGAGDGAPTRRSIRRCSIPACRRRSGRSGRATSARRCSTARSPGVYAPGSTFKMAVAMAGAGGAHHHAGRSSCIAPATSTSATRGSIAGARTATARSICAAGIKNSCDVYFYETAQARRHRPHRRDVAPLRSGHRTRDRPARRASRLHPDARMAHRPGPSLEPRRHGRLPASARATSRSRRCSLRPMPRASPPDARWSRT